MRIALGYAVLLVYLGASCVQPSASNLAAELSGEKALAHVRTQVAFGPRPPGSDALEKCRRYIVQQLAGFDYQVEDDAFETETPYGRKKMHNLIARPRKEKQGAIVLATHYDTKYMDGISFVGANDAGSSTGLLLELARVLAKSSDGLDYWFVFLDGEEAFVEWSSFDSTYGSRHLAQRWKREGTASRVHALILLDMIGDKNLDLLQDSSSTPWLRDLVWETAREIGLGSILSTFETAVQDDHIPFLDVGIPSVDIIDLNYGPGNSYHHTKEDTLDKVSADSMEKVGKLVLSVLPKLQKRFSQ